MKPAYNHYFLKSQMSNCTQQKFRLESS